MSKQGGNSVNLSNDKLSTFDRLLLEQSKKYEGMTENQLIDFNNNVKELEEYKLEKYNEWLNSDRHLTFKAKPIIEDYVIIEVFYYNVLEKQSSIILEDIGGKKLSDYKIVPIARVLASNSEKVSKGDLVSIPAVLSKTARSMEWVDWKQKVTEQPSLKHDFPEPPMYVGKLNEWVNYIYQENPLEDLSPLDQHTFCIPARMLQALEQ